MYRYGVFCPRCRNLSGQNTARSVVSTLLSAQAQAELSGLDSDSDEGRESRSTIEKAHNFPGDPEEAAQAVERENPPGRRQVAGSNSGQRAQTTVR